MLGSLWSVDSPTDGSQHDYQTYPLVSNYIVSLSINILEFWNLNILLSLYYSIVHLTWNFQESFKPNWPLFDDEVSPISLLDDYNVSLKEVIDFFHSLYKYKYYSTYKNNMTLFIINSYKWGFISFLVCYFVIFPTTSVKTSWDQETMEMNYEVESCKFLCYYALFL